MTDKLCEYCGNKRRELDFALINVKIVIIIDLTLEATINI